MSDQLVKFSSPERFLRDIMKDDADLAELIPKESKPDSILAKLRLCVGMGGEIRRWDTRATLAIGRCLALAAADPAIWKSAGYARYGDFFTAEVESKGIAHGTGYGVKRAIEVFKEMPVEDYINGGGITNLVAAAYALPKDASEGQKQEALDNLKMPVGEFRPWIEQQYGMTPGESSYAELKFKGNRAQVEEIVEWVNDAGNQDWAGSKHPLEMILAALHSASTEVQPAKPTQVPADHPAVQGDPSDW